MSTKDKKKKRNPNDLPIWACLIGVLPALVVKLLGFTFGESFLVYLAITSFFVAIWVVDRILHEVRALRQELRDYIERDQK